MGTVHENANFCGSETDFPGGWGGMSVCGEKIWGYQKKKEAPVLAWHGLLMHIRIVFMYGFCSSYSPGTQRGTFPVYELVCIVSIKMTCVSLRWQ